MNWLGGNHPYYHSESKNGDATICVLCGTATLILVVILAAGKLLGVIG